eukprot:gene10607-10765_t
MVRSRKKKDKWSDLLKETEEKYRTTLHEFQSLMQEQVDLRTRDTVLEQIVDAMSVMCGSVMQDSSVSHNGGSQSSSYQQESDVTAATPASQLHASMHDTPAGTTCTQARLMSFSPTSSNPPSNNERLPAATEEVVQELEARIQQQLSLANASSSGGANFPATQMLQVMCESLPVFQAKAKADVVLARLEHLAGRCALLLLHEPDDSAVWELQRALSDLRARGPAGGRDSCRPSTSDSHHAAAPCDSDAGSIHITDSADCASKVSDSAVPATSSELSLFDSSAHPAVEFMLLVLSALVLDDSSLFKALSCTNIESKRCPYSAPPEHWVRAAQKLQLSSDQVAVLTCMRQVISSSMNPLLNTFRQVARQQEAQADEQWDTLLHLYQFPEHHGPSVQGSLRQGQAAQEDSLGHQEQLLQQWKLLGLQQGIITMNCLSLKQMTTLITASQHQAAVSGSRCAVIPSPSGPQCAGGPQIDACHGL